MTSLKAALCNSVIWLVLDVGMLFKYLVIYLYIVLSLGVSSYESVRGRGPFEVIHLVVAFGYFGGGLL